MLDITASETELLTHLRRLFSVRSRGDARSVELALLHEILMEVRNMSDVFANELARLQADVAAQGTVIASATTAFQGLAAQLSAAETAARNAGATDAQVASLTAVRQGLETNTAALATAIPANTPAAPGVVAPSPTPTPTVDASAAAGPNAPSGASPVPVQNTGTNPATTTPVSNPGDAGQTTPPPPGPSA